MAASNTRGETEGDQDMSHIDVQQASEQPQRRMLSPRVVPSAIARQHTVSGSAVCESGSTNRQTDSCSAGEGASDVSVSSAVQQMDTLTISDKQQEVSPPVRHGVNSRSQGQKRRNLRDQAAAGSQRGAGRCDGHTQPRDGWRCVYDAVTSLPPEKVIRSVVTQCSSEWYQLGIELGFNDNDIQSMTFNIPTPAGKLQAIIEKKAMAHGKGKIVEALLDVCEQILPLATVAVMEDLGIKYTVPDHLLYEVGKKVGSHWKKLARCLGLTSQDVDSIKKKAKSSRKRAWKMLQLWHSRRDLSVSEIHRKCQIFPENVHIDQRVCGRRREMEGIAQEFWGQSDDKETPTEILKYCLQVVNGMGGVGKSALSEKYATEWQKMYKDGVFHFNAESLAALHNSIRRNLCSVSLKSEGGVFNDNQIFLQYVYSKDKVLLLYDGADDLELLKNVLPCHTAHVHVLVTTRMSGNDPILAKANKITSLDRLGPDAGVEALQSWRGHAGEELDGEELIFAKHLVSESPIEGLPLAITHVATCIRMGQLSYKQYYHLFKKEQRVLQALTLDMDKLLQYFRISSLKEPLMHHGISKPNDLSRLSVEDIQSIAIKQNDRHLLSMARYFIMNSDHVHLTWQLDIETMKDRDSNAMNLLLYISLMSCKNIPEHVVRPLLFNDVFAYQYHMAVSTLRSHALVDVSESNEGCSLNMHPLVQSTLLERVMRQPEELHYRMNRMAHSLLSFLPYGDSNIRRHLRDNQFLSLIPHVYSVAEKAVWICGDETCDNLVHTACQIAYQFQHIDVAAYLCNERLKATGVSASNWQRLQALYEMGRAFELMANPQSAHLHFMEALQLIENSSDQEKARMEHYYVVVLDGLARCYENQQMFIEAEHLYQTELSLLKKRPGDYSQEIAIVLRNLARSYNNIGQTLKAIETYEEVLEMQRGDPRTPSLILSESLLNLGWCLIENGQFEKALPLMERVLSIRRENLPENHLEVADALRSLSTCCENLGDLQRALNLCEESVGIASHCLPNDHPDIALFVGQLALCHRHAGRLDEAIHLTQQCVSILRQGMPSTRKRICSDLNNLGQLYKEKGMLAEAICTLEECLTVQHSILSPLHPEIGITLCNLGGAYKERNDVIKATELYRECLSIFEKCLSAMHPHLVAVLLALGDIALSQRQYTESLGMQSRAHDILKITLPNSERMAIVCYNIGVCYMNLSQFEAAEEALLESLRIVSTIYPQGHDEITITEQLLHEVWQLKSGQWQ